MTLNKKIIQTQKNVTKEEQKELIFNDLIKNDSMKYNFELFKSDWEPLLVDTIVPFGSRENEIHPMRGTFSLLTDEIYIPDNLISQINPQIKIWSPDGQFYESVSGQIHIYDVNDYHQIYNGTSLIYSGYTKLTKASEIDTTLENTTVTYGGNWYVKGSDPYFTYIEYVQVNYDGFLWNCYQLTSVSTSSISGNGFRQSGGVLYYTSFTVPIANVTKLTILETSVGVGLVETTFNNPSSILFADYSLSSNKRVFLDSQYVYPCYLTTDNNLGNGITFADSKYAFSDGEDFSVYVNHPDEEALYLSESIWPEEIPNYSYTNREQKISSIRTRPNYYKFYIEGSVLFNINAGFAVETNTDAEYTANIIDFSYTGGFVLDESSAVEPIILIKYAPSSTDILIQCTVNLNGKPIQNNSYGKR